jgi:PKD repeat protein
MSVLCPIGKKYFLAPTFSAGMIEVSSRVETIAPTYISFLYAAGGNGYVRFGADYFPTERSSSSIEVICLYHPKQTTWGGGADSPTAPQINLMDGSNNVLVRLSFKGPGNIQDYFRITAAPRDLAPVSTDRALYDRGPGETYQIYVKYDFGLTGTTITARVTNLSSNTIVVFLNYTVETVFSSLNPSSKIEIYVPIMYNPDAFEITGVQSIGAEIAAGTSCLGETIADFSADVVSGLCPLTAQFTDSSESIATITTWLWDFGDGTTSTEQNPQHTYQTPGAYTVSLTVNGYVTVTKADYITVEAGYMDIAIDAGAVYKDFGLPTEQIIGATRGGNVFKVDTEYADMPYDGAAGEVVGSKIPLRVECTVTANFIEISPGFLKLALPASETTETGTHYEIKRALQIALSDYSENITIVGEIHGKQEPIICGIRNALAVNNFEFSQVDNDESVIQVKFRGHYTLDDLETDPYFILYPEA